VREQPSANKNLGKMKDKKKHQKSPLKKYNQKILGINFGIEKALRNLHSREVFVTFLRQKSKCDNSHQPIRIWARCKSKRNIKKAS